MPLRAHPLAAIAGLVHVLVVGCGSEVENPGDGGTAGGPLDGAPSTGVGSTGGSPTATSSTPTSSGASVSNGPGPGPGPGTGGFDATGGFGGFGTGAGDNTGGFGTGAGDNTGGFGTGAGDNTGGFGTGTGGFGTGTGGFGTGTGGFGTGTGGFGTGTGGFGTGTGGGDPDAPCGAELTELVAAFRADHLIEEGVGDGSSVLIWPDEGPFGLDVAQALATARPTVHTDELGGHAVVEFDGEDDHLLGSLPIASFGDDPSITMIVVARASPLSFGEGRPLLRFGEASGNFAGVRLAQGDPGLGYGMFFDAYEGAPGFDIGIAHDAAAETSSPTLWTAEKSGADLALRKRGVLIGSADDAPILDVDDESFAIGTFNPGFDVWMGAVAEIAIFGPQLDPSDRAAVEACLIDRYGLP